jgi:hypothetical protein
MRTQSEVVEILLAEVIRAVRTSSPEGQVSLSPAVVIGFAGFRREFLFGQSKQTDQDVLKMDLLRLIWAHIMPNLQDELPEPVVAAIRAYDDPKNGDLTTPRSLVDRELRKFLKQT